MNIYVQYTTNERVSLLTPQKKSATISTLACCECADHAGKEDLPRQPHAPMGGHFFHGKEEAAHGGTKGRGNPGGGTSADKVATVLKNRANISVD